ncbi:ATP-binding cassette domain-containing protein [Alteromonas portus]|uniref:ATP-binding cassette domain-containing protein n=1 Tax=Alteromonas portus TaxID=2565549 RepID=A0A4V5NNE0_9ALTE|nr:ATP-binding cassette domain-containing protein [Alteromonas portus]
MVLPHIYSRSLMLYLSEFQTKLSNQYITPAFSISLCTENAPSHFLIAGKNSSGKSLLISALAGNGKVVSGSRECNSVVAEVSVFKQQALIEEEKQKDSADILDVIAQPTSVRELFAGINKDYQSHRYYNELASALRIEHLLDNGFLSLSTGETRKIIIMLAWLSNASIILLDEPFEGLDVEAISAFSRFIVSQQQASLVLTANKLADIPNNIQAQLIVMDDLAITWKSEGKLSYTDLRSELSTWFALESDDIDVPHALNANDKHGGDSKHKKQNSELDLLPHTLIQLKDGFVRFDERTIFEKLNFTLYKNEHWQITGPNGSGKTCLLQMFTGDNSHCYTNDLTMFGIKRGTGESIWDIKKHIGIMSNALHMQYKVNASVEHVIISGFHDSIGLYTRPTLAERMVAEQWLEVLGLKQKKNTPFQSLSFGDQRLVLIARSMVKHPAVLILDEPCNGLDDFNRQKALKLIDILAKAGTSTLLYVNHHAEERIPSIQNTLNMKDYNV